MAPTLLYPCQVATTLELNTSSDEELTPFPYWDSFGYEIPLARGTPIHNLFPSLGSWSLPSNVHGFQNIPFLCSKHCEFLCPDMREQGDVWVLGVAVW